MTVMSSDSMSLSGRKDYKPDVSYDDDDDRTIVVNSSEYESESSSALSRSSPESKKVGALDFSFASRTTGPSTAEAKPAIQEEARLVIFDLPDGSQGEKDFKLGHTVEYIKSFVEAEYGIPMARQTLYLHDGAMPLMDPMSLLDYLKHIQGEEDIYIKVDGPLKCRK